VAQHDAAERADFGGQQVGVQLADELADALFSLRGDGEPVVAGAPKDEAAVGSA
jgi:hypothetical protein